jgi:hypothetical protein
MKISTLLWALFSGALFGFGLSLSAMIRPEVVLAFLRFDDFGLLLVLGGAVIVALVVYQLVPKWLTKPLFGRVWGHHPSEWNARTFIGAIIFGIGWGLCGVCPGPAIAGLGAGNGTLLIAVAAIFGGAWVQGRFFGR